MVELSFLKSGSKYICEFEVSSDFNLHIEREKGGYLFLYQRSSEGGNYDSVGDAKFAPQDLVVDYDCSALIYPKWCKIESEVEPRYAAITTDGEVTEIKSQSKEVEITANGVTEIAPDAGFGYLSGVKVNVNVPSGGGGNGGNTGGVEYKYILYEPSAAMINVTMMGHIIKIVDTDGSTYFLPLGLQEIKFPDATIKAIAVPWNVNILFEVGMPLMPIGEVLKLMTDISALTFITEEEFYAL